jgi:hypothetical protein
MDIVTAIRSQMPVPAPQPPPAPVRAQAIETIRPVTATQRPDALHQPGSAVATALQLGTTEPKADPVSAARAAAETARDAYIRASIAAGVSALPLGGV